jgi:DNA repair protein RadC
MERALLARPAMDTDAASNPPPEPPTLTDLLPDGGDRPRERLWRCGTQSLGDAELLAILLGTGVRDRPVLAVAADLVQSVGGVAALSRASPHELAQVMGIGAARAARITAAFELGRRAVEVIHHRKLLGRAEDVYRCVAPRLAGLSQEVFIAIGVDVRNGLLDIAEVARGSVAHVEVHPREVFRPLVRMAAAGGVLVHNHPSGDPTPSHQDVELTLKLRDIGRILGIPIIDHVVIGDRSFRSIAEWMGTEF